MENIPTAEEYIKTKPNSESPYGTPIIAITQATQAMIEFAKLHVIAALKAADEAAVVTPIDHEEISEGSFRPIWGVDSCSILNAYPLENIK